MASHKNIKYYLINDKGTWTVRARLYDPFTKKYIQKTKSTGYKVDDKKKRKADARAREIVEEWERNATLISAGGNESFSYYVNNWIERKSLVLKANTILSYRMYADQHIIPSLGDIKMCNMNLNILQHFVNEKLKTLSVNSVRKYLVVISGAILDGVRAGIFKDNFANYVEFPKSKRFTGKAYNEDQVAKLLDAANKEGEPVKAAIILCVYYGLRRSEACGLRWQDIDFVKKEMHIRNTVTQNGSHIFENEDTKTDGSNRIITLIDSTVEYFQKLKETQINNGITTGKVCSWDDNRIVQPNYITHRIRDIMKKYGLEQIRTHDLRHTSASLLLARANPVQVQHFLGHRDLSTTTSVYGHLLDNERRATANIMDEIIQNTAVCSENCSEQQGLNT